MNNRTLQRQVILFSSARIHRRRLGHYTDVALLWGQANPQQAQTCLQPPPFPPTSITNSFRPNNWSDFWKWRNWHFSSSSNNSSSSRRHQEALVSHVLTGPLTLASHAQQNVQHWTCLGARAESMLPVPYWKEFLYYSHSKGHSMQKPGEEDDETTRQNNNISLSFIGPECDNVPSQQQLTWDNHSSLTLKWSFRGKYHDMPHEDSIHASSSTPTTSCHGFVLFNPGFAHPHLQKDWRPTLEKMWSKGSSSHHYSLVLTAHSAEDAERDWKLWHVYDSTIPHYVQNPWASQITYQDPMNSNDITIRPNAYVCHHVLT